MGGVRINKLPRDFYARDDVVQISRDLLGKVLCTRIDGVVTRMRITETEAYAGINDRASHAFGGRRSTRTEPMYGPPGHAYVYLCYGIHHLFNVVTNIEGVPHAVLIRAGNALQGEATMQKRRGKRVSDRRLLAGPGSVGQALGITTALSGTDLQGKHIWIEDQDFRPRLEALISSPRIGVAYAGDDAALPYRFIATEFS